MANATSARTGRVKAEAESDDPVSSVQHKEAGSHLLLAVIRVHADVHPATALNGHDCL